MKHQFLHELRVLFAQVVQGHVLSVVVEIDSTASPVNGFVEGNVNLPNVLSGFLDTLGVVLLLAGTCNQADMQGSVSVVQVKALFLPVMTDTNAVAANMELRVPNVLAVLTTGSVQEAALLALAVKCVVRKFVNPTAFRRFLFQTLSDEFLC